MRTFILYGMIHDENYTVGAFLVRDIEQGTHEFYALEFAKGTIRFDLELVHYLIEVDEVDITLLEVKP